MTRFCEPTRKMQIAWTVWVESRPDNVREVAARFDPWTLYRLKNTNQRVTIHSINENGTVAVNITGDFNFLINDRRVSGIDPNDLEECALPAPDEIVGSILSQEEVFQKLDALRVLVRPDIWVMGEDGKAVKRE